MSKRKKQRKSWRWVMMVGLQKNTLINQVPVAPIKELENSTFIPSVADCKSLEKEKLCISYNEGLGKVCSLLQEASPSGYVKKV